MDSKFFCAYRVAKAVRVDDGGSIAFDTAAARLPARRVGQPGDMVQAILFVAATPFATGSTVTVGGGGTISV